MPPYTVTPNTVLEFDFWSDGDPAEINGVGLDTQLATAIPEQTFQIYGTHAWTNSIQDFYGYAGGWQHYVIPVGLYYPAGDFAYLFFVDDADAGQNTSVRYRNPQFHEGPGAPIAQDDTFTVVGDSTNNLLAVLANDTDPGDTLTITSVDTTGTQGTAFIHDNGTPADSSDDGISYSTSIGFTGTDSFSYTIEDSGGLSASATVTVTVDPLDFALTASPSIVEVFAGDDALFQIDVSPVGGFTDDVTLTVPASPGAVFAPPVIVGGSGSSVLTVPTDSSGLFPLTVVGTSGSLIHPADVTLDVVDFALTVSPSATQVLVGDAAQFQIDVSPLAGFTGDVTLTLPASPGAVFTPAVIVSSAGSSVLTVPTDTAGTFALSVEGTSSSRTHAIDITLDVADFVLNASPSIVEVFAGDDAQFQIDVSPVGGFTDDVTLTLPASLGAVFTPPVIVGGSGSSVLTVPTVATGSFPLSVVGTSGPLIHPVDVTLDVVDFALTVSPSATQVLVGDAAQFQIDVSPLAGFTGDVTLTLPASPGAVFTPAVIVGGAGSSVLTVPTDTAGTFALSVEGTSSSRTHAIDITLDVADFVLNASPSIVEVFAGDDAQFQIDVSPLAGFTGDVTLTLPASPGAVFTPAVIVGGAGSSVLTVPTDSSGLFPLNVVGTSESRTHTVDITLDVVDPPDFALNASPSTLAVIVGDDAVFQVDVTPIAGFTDDVTLTVLAFPGAFFTPPVIVGGSGSSVLTVPTLATGSFPLSVVGTTDSLAHPVDITLDVVDPPDFALNASPSTLAVIVGDDAVFQIDVTPIAGFTDDVTLTVPAFPGAFFTPPVVGGGSGSSVLTLPTLTAGAFSLSVVGTSGSLAHPVDITLDVADFALNASPSALAVIVGDDAVFQIDVTPIAGFTDDVTLTVPAFPGALFTPSVVGGGSGSSVLTLPTLTAGAFSLSVVGTSGSLAHPVDITLDVADFALNASPSALAVIVGDDAVFQVDVTPIAGFTDEVTLTVPAFPGALFTPSVVGGGSGSSVLTLPTLTAGAFSLSVVGTSGSLAHPVDITLDVADFALNASPATQAVNVGDDGLFQINVSPLAGFTDDVTLTIPALPGAFFTPPVIVGGSGSSVLTVPTLATGTIPFTVVGSGGSLTHPIDITLNVVDFVLNASPANQAVSVDDDALFWINVTPLAGFTDDVTLTIPAFPEAFFAPPVIVGGSGSSVLTVPTLATAGTFGFSVVGTSGSLIHPVDLTLNVAEPLEFPSPDAVYLGIVGSGALGPGGGSAHYWIGTKLTETFAGTGISSTDSSRWVFDMSDFTLAGVVNTFDLLVNDQVVGGFSFAGGTDPIHHFDLSLVHEPPIQGDTYTLSIVSTSTVFPGGGAWNWISGGTVDLTGFPDFAVNISPATETVFVGDDAQFQIDVIHQAGFTGDVTLTVPAFPGAVFTPPVIVGGWGSSVLTLPTTAVGTIPVSVVGTSGSLTHPVNITLNVVDPPEFALNASPATQAVVVGNDAQFQIDVSPLAGFTDDVTLTLPGSPGAVFAPSVIAGGSGSSVLTVPTDAAGTLGLSVVGTSGSLIRLLDFTLTVVDFALTVSPSTLEVIVGDDGHVQVDVIPLAGFTDDVALTVPDFPGAFFTPSVIAGGSGSSVLTLPTIATGAFGLSVIGTSASLTHPVDITLDVVPPPPDFALTVSPSAVEVTVGNDALFQINVTPVAGFTGDVTLTVPDFPGAFFTPSVITEASGSSVLTLPTVTTGSFPILIHGTYGTPGAAVETNLVVTFNENVVKGTGNITIVETGVGTFEAIPVNTGQVSVSGPMLSIDPAGTLANGTAYHVLIDATAIDDTSGNSFAGLELATDWDFTTTTVGVITHAVGITLDVLDPPTSP